MYAHLIPPTFRETVRQWIQEDVPTTDIGGFVVGEKIDTAHLLCKASKLYDNVVVAGIPFVDEVFKYFELDVAWLASDGDCVNTTANPKSVVAKVTGPCRKILMAERVALNLLSRASGIATQTKRMCDIAKKAGWNGSVAGTRKTTPGFRLVEKYALVVGGAATHRDNLSAMVMLKDNHIWSTGSITAATRKARSVAGFSMKIEVECQSEEEALEACAAGADIVMLDNFSPPTAGFAAERVKSKFPHCIIEVSGGITEETLSEYFHPSVDVLSMGALTQGYFCVDFSLKIQKTEEVWVHP